MSAVELTGVDVAATTPRRRLVSTRFLRSELGMVFRRRRNQIALGVLALAPVLIAVAVKVGGPPQDGRGPDFVGQITQNGIFVAFAALTAVIPFFLPLAVSVASGDAIAGEASAGTLRYLLTLPVNRGRLLAVKYAGVVAYCGAAALVVSAVGLLVGLALFPTGAATLLSGTQVSYGAAAWRLLLTSLYVAGCMAALAAVGLLVSAQVESSVAAIATTSGIAITSQILDAVPQLHAIHPYLLSHWWLSFGDLLRTPMATDDVLHGLAVAAAYAGLCLSLAWTRFTNRDVSS